MTDTQLPAEADQHQLARRVAQTPSELVQLAIERGLDGDQLNRLLDFAERLQGHEAKRQFNEAMTDCQAEIQTVVSDAQNPKTRSRFARLETVQAIAKPVYTSHGFSLSFSEGKPDKADHMRIVCRIRHKAGHAEEHYIELPYDGVGPKGERTSMNAVQGVGSTYSYGARYLTVRIFSMTIAGEDNDGNDPRLSKEQIGEINELIDECRKLKKPVDFNALLRFLLNRDPEQNEGLENVPASRFATAIHELNRKRRS